MGVCWNGLYADPSHRFATLPRRVDHENGLQRRGRGLALRGTGVPTYVPQNNDHIALIKYVGVGGGGHGRWYFCSVIVPLSQFLATLLSRAPRRLNHDGGVKLHWGIPGVAVRKRAVGGGRAHSLHVCTARHIVRVSRTHYTSMHFAHFDQGQCTNGEGQHVAPIESEDFRVHIACHIGTISLGDIHNMPTRSKFVYSQGFLHFSSRAPKFLSVGGGMCILFEICENRPFQKCMG